MQWHPFLAGARHVRLRHMKLDALLRRAGGGWEMSSSGQAAGRGRWRNAVIGPDGGSGRLGNVSIGPDGELGEVGECYHGELHEMLAGIRLNVLRGVEPRRLHHLCSVSFELVCQ